MALEPYMLIGLLLLVGVVCPSPKEEVVGLCRATRLSLFSLLLGGASVIAVVSLPNRKRRVEQRRGRRRRGEEERRSS